MLFRKKGINTNDSKLVRIFIGCGENMMSIKVPKGTPYISGGHRHIAGETAKDQQDRINYQLDTLCKETPKVKRNILNRKK